METHNTESMRISPALPFRMVVSGSAGFVTYLLIRHVFSIPPAYDFILVGLVGLAVLGHRLETMLSKSPEMDLDDALVMFLIAGYMTYSAVGTESLLIGIIFMLEPVISQTRKYFMSRVKI